MVELSARFLTVSQRTVGTTAYNALFYAAHRSRKNPEPGTGNPELFYYPWFFNGPAGL